MDKLMSTLIKPSQNTYSGLGTQHTTLLAVHVRKIKQRAG